jgi:hypothetical protein
MDRRRSGTPLSGSKKSIENPSEVYNQPHRHNFLKNSINSTRFKEGPTLTRPRSKESILKELRDLNQKRDLNSYSELNPLSETRAKTPHNLDEVINSGKVSKSTKSKHVHEYAHKHI